MFLGAVMLNKFLSMVAYCMVSFAESHTLLQVI